MQNILKAVLDATRLLFYAVTHEEMLSNLPEQWTFNSTVITTETAIPLSFQRKTITVEDIAGANLPNYSLAAIPGFFILCMVEFVVGLTRGKQIYRINDGFTSFMLGSIMLLFQTIVGKTIGLAAYCWIWSHFGLQNLIPLESWFHYVGLLLAADCGYYWFHRTAHEYHISWASHSVHHSGEDYNLATALRQGAGQMFVSWPFYLSLAIFFHPALFVMHKALNTLGQFWIHTTLIGHVGILEYVINSPSHHRMHHRPPGNCNYAGVLIIWDRMFGTFVAEQQQRDFYGLAKQYQTFDPMWANFEHIKRQILTVHKRKNKSIITYILQFFKKRVNHPFVFEPQNLFKTIHPTPNVLWKLPDNGSERPRLESKWSHPLLTVYIVFQFFFMLVISLGFLTNNKKFTNGETIATSTALILSFASLGRLLDGNVFGFYFESTRCLLLLAIDMIGLFTPKGLPIQRASISFAVQIQISVWMCLVTVVKIFRK